MSIIDYRCVPHDILNCADPACMMRHLYPRVKAVRARRDKLKVIHKEWMEVTTTTARREQLQQEVARLYGR